MQSVEQAIFTTLDADYAAHYQIVAQSAGLCECDAQQLKVWGPSRDSLLDENLETESLNFHPLPSGAYCVSRTAVEDCGHRGRWRRAVTRCLIVPPDVLARFGNNPFALCRSAAADAALRASYTPGVTLHSLLLAGGAAVVDRPLLEQLAVDPGPESMAALVQTAREAVCLAVGGSPSAANLMEGLFHCLPPECRLEYSFSTGLKFSPHRPFHVVALEGDTAERQWIAHCSNVVVLELPGDAASTTKPLDSWSRFIERTLATGQIGFRCLTTT